MIQFQERYLESKQKDLFYKKKSNRIALARFLLIVGVIVNLLTGYFQNKPILYFIALILFVGFMILIVYHDQMKEQSRYYQALSNVYQEHIQRQNGQWDEFKEDGSCFIEENQNLSLDLDIFGKHSLFQMLNITFTKRGQEKLAKAFLYPQDKQIIKRQQAVDELSQKNDFIIEVQTFGKIMPHFSYHQLEDFIQLSFVQKVIKPYLSLGLSFITIIGLTMTLMQVGTPYSYVLLEVGFVLQICVSMLTLKKHSQLFAPIQDIHKNLESYTDIFQTIHKQQFTSELLKDLYRALYNNGNVIAGMKELSQISQRVQYRQNIFAFLFLNGLFGFDILVSYQYQQWLNQYHQYMDNWFEQLALLESLMSLSVLKMDAEKVVMPCITQQPHLSFYQLKHPLLKKETVMGNDFSLHKNVNIITGSNMSGKTTFMRTIALNLVLAYAGGFVFADEMACSYMHILTSMRVKDNVEEGISTFYGELLRIKEMIEYSKNQQPMICFIDEIFKGTNSLDRIAGAKATIQKLSLPYCFTFLTTHDFELCLIDHVQCQNYHFDEYYQNERIYFDYQIKSGPSTSSNGQFLLKQLGIMEE